MRAAVAVDDMPVPAPVMNDLKAVRLSTRRILNKLSAINMLSTFPLNEPIRSLHSSYSESESNPLSADSLTFM